MLPPQSRYNLASLSTDDDTHEWAVGQMGGPAYGQSGFGWSDVFNELLSRDPKYVPVSDLTQMQSRLQNMGYVHPSVPADGTWSPVWAAGARRSDRDSLDLVRSGQHFAAAPVKKFFEYLTYTVPTGIMDGIFGVAKGIAEDAQRAVTNPVEVFQEGGLLGGAAVGAAAGAPIGAALGSIVPGAGTAVGAIVGGAVGGIAGFFGDLFDDDEDEEGNWQKILGALSPVEEISSGDAKNLFAGLSTVMTASGFLKAGSLAIKGTTGALSAASPSVAGATVREAGLREAFRRAAAGTVEPGLAGSVLRAAARKPVLGGAIAGSAIDATPELLRGEFGAAAQDAVRGAVVGGLLGAGFKRIPKAQQGVIAGLERAPLQRALQAPAGQIARHLYTGFSTAGISGHIAGELPGTGVSKALEEKPDYGVAGDVLDWTVGLALYPNRLLPFKFREAGQAIEAMGSKNALYPFAKAAMRYYDDTGKLVNRKLSEAFTYVEQTIGRDVDGKFDKALLASRVEKAYLEKGLDDRARELARQRTYKTKDPVLRNFQQQRAFQEERGKLVAQAYEEAGSSEFANSPLAKERLEDALSNPASMQGHIQEDFLIEHWAVGQKADEYLQKRTLEIVDAEGSSFAFTPAVKGQYLTQQEVHGLRNSLEGSFSDYRDARKAVLDQPDNMVLRDHEARAAERMDQVLVQLKGRELINDADYMNLKPGQLKLTEPERILKRLDEVAELRPKENPGLTRELEQQGLDRYIAIETGPDLLHYGTGKLLEVSGAAEFARRRPFFDALSDAFTKIDDMDMGRLRYQSIAAYMDQFAIRLGLTDGKQVTDRIYDSIKGRYDIDVAKSQGYRLDVMRGGRVRRTDEATKITKTEWFKIDPRDLRPDDLVEGLKLDKLDNVDDPLELANDIKAALHQGAAFGADVMHPITTARALGANLRVTGLPGFNDYMRTARIRFDKFPKLGKWAKEGSYGYIPHNLRRAHMAVQFSLSPTFDASRYVEAMSFGAAKGMMPISLALRPGKLVRESESISVFDGQKISGEDAIKQMHAFADDVLYNRPVMQGFDELQFRLLNAGFLNFRPREVEAGQLWWLAQKRLKAGKSLDKNALDEMRETVLEINRYGKGQTTFAKSLHFVFFPYLFQAKQLRALEGFVLGAPTRNLLVHEGFRRWYGLEGNPDLSKSFNDAMEKHLPIAKELERLNNLSYGIGPGRFFLEGMLDRTTEGKVAQGLGSFFLPGGVHQPVAESAGKVTEAFKQLFVPVVLYERDGTRLTSPEKFRSIAEGLIPAYRDVERWFFNNGQQILADQGTAISEGQTATGQYEDYANVQRMMDLGLEQVATELGYASVDSLRQSAHGPIVSQFTGELDNMLASAYPSGAEIATRFRDWDSIKGQALNSIRDKSLTSDLTDAERAIQTVGIMEDQAKAIAEQSGIPQADVLRMVAPLIRQFALAHVEDRQFNNLWETLFAFELGPIRAIAA